MQTDSPSVLWKQMECHFLFLKITFIFKQPYEHSDNEEKSFATGEEAYKRAQELRGCPPNI